MKTNVTADAAVRLMLHYPFWCELYYSMPIIEDESIGTLATDGKRCWVNPKFWVTLSLDLKISALAHEIIHKMLHHPTRRNGRDPFISNIAADYVVNGLLAENGFKIGPGWVQPLAKYKGWSFEAVYNDLIKNLKPPPPQPSGGKGKGKGAGKPQPGKPQPGDGDPEEDDDGDDGTPQGRSPYAKAPDVPDEWKRAWRDVKDLDATPEEVEQHEAEVEQAVAKAITAARAMGHSPAGIDMATSVTYIPKEEPWYNHLHRYMQSLAVSEFNWARMNKRHAVLHRVFAPANYHEALGEVIVAADASGSMYDTYTQGVVAGHINAILSEAKPRKVHVLFFDTVVHKAEELDAGAIEFESNPVGGGGTSFVDIFEWAEREGIIPAVCIVLTDLEGTFPLVEPEYPVVWASIRNHVAPFGETIYVN